LYNKEPDPKENKNSWKWNNVVLKHGKDVTDSFFEDKKIYDQSLLEAFKFANE